MASITEFKSMLYGGGARANQFVAYINFPSWVSDAQLVGQRTKVLCKAASLPASLIQNVEVQYRGRQVNFAGERAFQPWTITIYNDTTTRIRDAFEQWQARIQNYTTTNGETQPQNYQMPLDVYQLDRNGSIIKAYKFINSYPTVIGQIQLDYDAPNQIEMFDVEFTYDYFTSNKGTDTDGKAFDINVSVDLPFVGTVPLT